LKNILILHEKQMTAVRRTMAQKKKF